VFLDSANIVACVRACVCVCVSSKIEGGLQSSADLLLLLLLLYEHLLSASSRDEPEELHNGNYV